METSGWGRYPKIDAQVHEPVDRAAIASVLKQHRSSQLIARGAGRSYGDSSLAPCLLTSRFLDNFIAFDSDNGVISCASGVTLEQVLDISVPRGWLLPVLPGTRFVSVGGAIASDVHGKNHHGEGCFSRFVESFTLMLASGETVSCSRDNNRSLFEATCGGMGLTGIILEATLVLEKIDSAYIDQQTLCAANLEEVFALFDEHAASKYSVAWIDCLARGAKTGRSVLFLGEQAGYGHLEDRKRTRITAPPYSPAALINRFTIGAFNRLYYGVQTLGRANSIIHYKDFFFPLDWIHNWNRLYGSQGFLQYQFVVPDESARRSIEQVLGEISSRGKGSFLSVLKKMGAENANPLSFPLQGYTLALDFKVEPTLFELLDRLDRIVVEHGGRLYLTKDARMSEEVFKRSYPRWKQFEKIRLEVDPDSRFGSLQSRRLGLGNL